MKASQTPPSPAHVPPRAEARAPSPARPLTPGRAVLLPMAFAAALVAMAFLLPLVRQNPTLFRTFTGGAALLVAWGIWLESSARKAGRTLFLQVGIYKHHWVQACAQIALFIWWGWYVRSVVSWAPLIVAQLIFAYGVDSLLNWSRRDLYRVGFGPWPIILSINLFLWFKPDWFYFQFAMILVGYLAKELIRWQRDGRSAHIFNPSSFPLAATSLALLLTGATSITLGQEIAQTQFNPPHMYLAIFLVSLPAQLLFGVVRMTLAAVVTTFAISWGYFAATGTYLFYDAFISLPVFLGMHLIVTDPSTSPRSESGRIAFGAMYGLGVVGVYVLLRAVGAPSFYDKLLPVPLLNLMVRRIDAVERSGWLARLDPARIGRAISPATRNLGYTSIWAGVFLALSLGHGVGDRHPGQYLPFWNRACEDGSERACRYANFMTFNYCTRGSGWACNEWGAYLAQAGDDRAGQAFQRSCELGFEPACDNANHVGDGAVPAHAPPRVEDLPIVLRGSKGPVMERDPDGLYAMACQQGWEAMCGGIMRGKR